MGLKKGIYFSIDSILASAIILVVIVVTSTFYLNEQPSFHVNYLSQDLIATLSTANIVAINNEYINNLPVGTITNTDNSVLGQIGEFWADGKIELANKTAANVTERLVPENFGYGIWINNETIYTRDLPLTKTLISSKKFISGIPKVGTSGLTRSNPPTLWGPVIAEVRIWQ